MRLVIDPKKIWGTFPFYYDMNNIPDEIIIMRVDSSLRLVVLCVKVNMFLQAGVRLKSPRFQRLDKVGCLCRMSLHKQAIVKVCTAFGIDSHDCRIIC